LASAGAGAISGARDVTAAVAVAGAAETEDEIGFSCVFGDAKAGGTVGGFVADWAKPATDIKPRTRLKQEIRNMRDPQARPERWVARGRSGQ